MTVNKVSKLEQYPIPSLEGSVYHKLDLSHAQIELEQASRKFVTVNIQHGLYQYTRLPFGVSSAPAIFQPIMDTMFQKDAYVGAFFNDILVTGCRNLCGTLTVYKVCLLNETVDRAERGKVLVFF